MSTSQQSKLLPGFAGIALADILANSVAMIIILIVITMMVKHEQEQARLMEVEDVSVLLSRDIATSVVMNGLPTSKPARLHDYINSPLDINPHPSIMPIIELHRNYVQDYYSKQKFSRAEMLKAHNRFDDFLAQMTSLQKESIRIDIYDIQMFYLTMSIIADHTNMPRHWHFLGYDTSGTVEGEDLASQAINHKESNTSASLFDSTDEENNSSNEIFDESTWQGLPSDIDLEATSEELNYPFDDLAYDRDIPISENSNGDSTRQSDEMFMALAEMLSDSINRPSSQPGLPNILQFRTAVPSSAKTSTEKNREIIQMRLGSASNGESLDYMKVIMALFRFMERTQRAVEEGNYLMLQNFDFEKDILQVAVTMTPSENTEEINFFEQLKEKILNVHERKLPILLAQDKIKEQNKNILLINPNDLLEGALFVGNTHQQTLNDIPGKAFVKMHVGLYPAIYKGLKIPLDKGSIILFAPNQVEPQKFRWRVATIISPQRDDYLLAFIYAAITEDGALSLATDENNITINQVDVATSYPNVLYRKENEALMIYGLVTLLLVVGILRKFLLKI